MATTESHRAVHCPKCGAGYKLRAGFRGNVKCRKCQTAFAVGASRAEREGAASRDRQEHKTAVKLLVLGGLALLLVAGLIGLAATSGGGGPHVPKLDRKEEPFRYRSERRTDLGGSVPISKHPPEVATRFIRALGKGDRETVAELFLFDWYFAWVDRRYEGLYDPPYAEAPPEVQAERREAALDELMDPGRAEYIDRFLTPQLEADREWVWVKERIEKDFADLQVRCRDEQGDDLLTMFVGVRLRKGMTPLDGSQEGAWGVYRVQDQWHQSLLHVAEPDRRLVDAIVGRKREREREARRAAAMGPPEADPEFQDPVPGTSSGLQDEVRTAIRQLNEATGSDWHAARDKLKAIGKPAIPFLLNALIGKDIQDEETDIRAANAVIDMLREITGQHFGWAPGQAAMPMQSVATASEEERLAAVRRWFGWWKHNKRSWTGREPGNEEEEDLGRRDRVR